MFEYYFFDLDGTLTNPALGITNSFKYAFKVLGIEIPSYEKLCTFIGPPLVTTFKTHCGFNDEEAKLGVKKYREYFAQKGLFENPKPVELISHLIEITAMPKNSLIMDFFAGSGTTFEAVCQLNKKDGGTRQAILIQKPEPLQESGPYKNISDLCWARIQKNAISHGQDCKKIKLE